MTRDQLQVEQCHPVSVASARILAVRDGALEEREDWLAVESALEIRARGRDEESTAVAVTMRTPGHDAELAVGFLFTEGLIRSRDDLTAEFRDAAFTEAGDDDSMIEVVLARPFKSDWSERRFLATSSCGVCGKATLDQVSVGCRPLTSSLLLKQSALVSMPDALRHSQPAFGKSGGLHAAGLFDDQGSLMIAREDVGRHNAVDKLVGRMLLERQLPLEHEILLVSGRVSFEILQKAAMAGITIVCAVSAPSSLAVHAAQSLGVTLVGFLRGRSFNIYTHSERVDPRN